MIRDMELTDRQRAVLDVDYRTLEEGMVRRMGVALRYEPTIAYRVRSDALYLRARPPVAPVSDEYTFSATKMDFHSASLQFRDPTVILSEKGRREQNTWWIESVPRTMGGVRFRKYEPVLTVDEVALEVLGVFRGPKAVPLRELEPKTRWEILLGEDLV